MEVYQPLVKFYEPIEIDSRIGVTHISLYMALLMQWNLNGGLNPVEISRSKLMKTAKINSRFTFYKCMKDLNDFRYINYKTTFSKFSLSMYSLRGLK